MHKKIFEIQPTLLTYYQDSRKKSLHVIDRFSFYDHRLFHCLHCNDFSLSCAVECLSNQTVKEDPLFYTFFQGILNINCLWSDLSIHTVVQKRLIFCQGVWVFLKRCHYLFTIILVCLSPLPALLFVFWYTLYWISWRDIIVISNIFVRWVMTDEHQLYGLWQMIANGMRMDPYCNLFFTCWCSFQTSLSFSLFDVGLLTVLVSRYSSSSVIVPADKCSCHEVLLCLDWKALYDSEIPRDVPWPDRSEFHLSENYAEG